MKNIQKSNSRRIDPDFIPFLLAISFFVLLAVSLVTIEGYRNISKAGPRRDYVGTVTDKTVKKKNQYNDLYLVFTENEQGEMEVLEVSDSLIAGRFDSSDLYGRIEIGKKYRFKVAGTRNYFFSWYPNIYEAEEVKEGIDTTNSKLKAK